MPDISSIGNGQVGPINRGSRPLNPAEKNGLNGQRVQPHAGQPQTDSVELSDRARYLDLLRQIPDVREDRVNAVRQSISEGTYETEGRLNVALERLVADLQG